MFVNILILCFIQYSFSQKCDANEGGILNLPPILANLLGDTVCDECIRIADAAKKELESEKIKNMVHDLINTVCDDLPLEDQCKKALNSVFESLISRVNKIDSKGLCQSLHLCEDKKKCKYSEEKQKHSIQTGKAHDEPGSCEVCKDSIQVALDALKSQQVKEMLNNALKQACEAIPSEALKDRCNALFSGPFVRWLEALIPRVDGEKVCEMFGLCDDKMYSDPNDDPACDLCTSVVSQLKSVVESPDFDKRLKHIIDRMCAYCVGHTQQCRSKLNGYIDEAIKAVKKWDPKKICKDAHLC